MIAAAAPVAGPVNETSRLLAAARILIDEGLALFDVEARVFAGLTEAPGDDLPSRRAALFRAAVGVPAPLSRSEASSLTTAIVRELRGARDSKFDHQYRLAHARGRLLQAAHDRAEEMRRDGVEITRDNLELRMMMTIASRGGEVILVNPIDVPIEDRVAIAVRDFFREAAQ